MYNILLLRWKYINMQSWARKNNIDFPYYLESLKIKNPTKEQIYNDYLILKTYECKGYLDFLLSFN